MLNESLKMIDFKNDGDNKTYIQLTAGSYHDLEVKKFKNLLNDAMPNMVEYGNFTLEQKMDHFREKVLKLLLFLKVETVRSKVLDARKWFQYKAEEYNRDANTKAGSHESMGHLSGGEKAQMTYTILGSAIAYQFGLTKGNENSNSFRFIAIDEAFKAQDEEKATYLMNLCKQLNLQLLVVTPADNIHIVENHISFVHFVHRERNKQSELSEMSIHEVKELMN